PVLSFALEVSDARGSRSGGAAARTDRNAELLTDFQEYGPHMGSPSAVASEADLRPTWVRYLVLASLCLAAMLAYIPRNCIGVAEADIRSDLGLSKEQMSW